MGRPARLAKSCIAPPTFVSSEKPPITSWFGGIIRLPACGVFEMTPSLRRFAAILCGFAVCSFVAAVLPLAGASAQSTSSKARAAPSAKSHAAAKNLRASTPWVPNPNVGSKDSYLIVDAASGRELASDQADELRHPASLTKLMTLYLTFSALDFGPALARRRAAGVDECAERAADQDGHDAERHGPRPRCGDGAGDALGQRCRRRCWPKRWAATRTASPA